MKLRRNAIFLSAAAASAINAVMSGVLAQESSATDDQAVQDVIVVIGRGREENVQDVPISETVFTADDIQDARIDRVDDFFALTPGVTFANTQDSGTSFISIRGISQVRNGEAPVAVVIDDVLQTSAISFDQPLFDVESIEILRGPQGALYGRNATGGAVIITTAAPTDEFEGYGQISYGRGNLFQAEGSVSGPIVPGRILGRFSVRYSDFDGALQNVILNEPVDYEENTSLRGHLRFIVSDNVTADLRGALVRTNGHSINFSYQPAIVDKMTGIPTAFDFSIADADLVEREFTANNLSTERRELDQISLRINAELGFATLRSVTAYDHMTQLTGGDQFPYTFASTITPAAPFPLGDGVQSQYFDIEALSQELRLTSPDDQRFRWMVGGYYVKTDRFINSSVYDDLENGLTTIVKREPTFDPLAPLTSFVADDNSNNAWALFFNTAFDVTDRLEIAFAGRYDRDEREQQVLASQGAYSGGVFVAPIGVPGSLNKAEFDLFQPKATIRYNALENLNLYASWGKGFRSGQFNQNGVGAVAQAAGVQGVTDLLAQEETSTYEVGFKSTLADGITLNASGYKTNVTNAPYFVFIGSISAQVLVPIDEIEIWGGEVELAANLYEGLDFYTSFGLADTEINQYTVNPGAVGNRAPYIAKTTFNAGLQYRTPITSGIGIFGRVDYERRGPQFWDPENTTARSALNLVNARAGFESNDGAWSLMASVDNLTDEVYNSEWVLGGFAHAAPPRLWRLDLRVNF